MTDQVRRCALEMERVDTHGHLGVPFRDLRAAAKAGDKPVAAGDMHGARAEAEGCRRLYGIDPGVILRSDAPEALFAKAAELRAAGGVAAIVHALDVARIGTQLVFQGSFREDNPLRQARPRIRFLAYLDPALTGGWESFSPDFEQSHPEFCYYEAIEEHFGTLSTLDRYLEALDALIDGWRADGVVGMKTAAAYTIGLEFGDPSLAKARGAFRKKGTMSRAEIRTVHDYAFRHALLACRRNRLPVVIHTGFQIWGHADLRQSNPILLHRLLIDPRYRDLTFVLLHGGNPYVGETTYLASMFPNVIIDFTWISWMTRGRFRAALTEWLEVVPHDRLCWGSDSGTPESIVGTDAIVRREIAHVLEDAIRDGILDERGALAFLENCYRKTAQRVFSLPHADSEPADGNTNWLSR